MNGTIKVQLSLVALLLVCIFATGMGLIYTKHRSRQLFAELQKLQQAQDELQTEWSQLLLEQGTWATDSRVERVAKQELNMETPAPEKVIVIR